MTQRQAFEDALKENPYDVTTRKVFADWLDEHDEPELAELQRRWTPEAYEEALAWFNTFRNNARDNGEVEYPSVQALLQAGVDYLTQREFSVVSGLGFAADNYLNDEGMEEAYWKHWEILMEIPIAGKVLISPFTCCA